MLKQIDRTKAQSYIPLSDRLSEKPTKIYFIPMNKKDYDEYTDSLAEFKRGKLVTHGKRSGEIIFDRCLFANENGVFIENTMIDGKEVLEIKDKIQAVKFLLGLPSEDANEIEQVFRGQSSLNEEEIKN